MRFAAFVLAALGANTAAAYWLQDITHNGKSPYNSDSNYVVWRDVKQYGAKGDGTTDDTAAIQHALTGRCMRSPPVLSRVRRLLKSYL